MSSLADADADGGGGVDDAASEDSSQKDGALCVGWLLRCRCVFPLPAAFVGFCSPLGTLVKDDGCATVGEYREELMDLATGVRELAHDISQELRALPW